MVASPQSSLSPDAYLQFEAQSPHKHEYNHGHAYAMAGVSDAHVTIAGNLFALLRGHLRGSGYRVYIADMYIADMKVRIDADSPTRQRFYYPDVVVTCDRRDQDTPLYKSHPTLIVEVLSTSTEAFDRGDKFIDYQRLPSLEEYLIDQHPAPAGGMLPAQAGGTVVGGGLPA